MLSGFSISYLGDFFAQSFIEKKSHDGKRGLVIGSYGALEIGFEGKLYLPLLDKIFGKQMNKFNALKKLMIDQIIYTPTETACFMKWTNSLEKRPETYEEKMSRDYIFLLGSNLLYWGPVSFINFCFVPIQYRALYVALTTLIIDTFSSFAAHNNLRETFQRILKLK